MRFVTTASVQRVAMLVQLAARNVLRQRARTAMTLAAIAFGVVGLILSGGFVADLIVQLREAVIHSQTGHLQLARSGFFTVGSRSPEKYLIADPTSVAAALSRDSRVTDVMSRVTFPGLLNNGRTDLPVIAEGIEPAKEARLGTHMVISEGRALAAQDHDGVLVGRGLADALKLKVGDRATLVASTPDGAMNTHEVRLIGVFQSYSRDYDARAVRIPLAAAHELLGNKGANIIVVALRDSGDTEAVARDAAKLAADQQLDVRTWNQLSDFYEKTVALYERQFGVLRLIVLFMVLLGVANSVNMSVFERVGEFGTMRALGNRNRDLYSLLVVEAVVLALAGAALGVLVGIALAGLISWIGIPMPPPPNSDLGYTAHIQLAAPEVLGAALVGFLATALAFIPASLRVAKIPVVDALRQNI